MFENPAFLNWIAFCFHWHMILHILSDLNCGAKFYSMTKLLKCIRMGINELKIACLGGVNFKIYDKKFHFKSLYTSSFGLCHAKYKLYVSFSFANIGAHAHSQIGKNISGSMSEAFSVSFCCLLKSWRFWWGCTNVHLTGPEVLLCAYLLSPLKCIMWQI